MTGFALSGLVHSAAAVDTPGSVSGCAAASFEGTDYVVCTADPTSGRLRMFWKDAEGNPYRRFGALADALESKGQSLSLALNGGMYDTDFRPIGLYVEDGKELRPLNKRKGPSSGPVPNFFKKPNGVFYLKASGAGIVTTEKYAAKSKGVTFATQSGPMLVIEGKLHPALIAGSTDRTRRSGVGVCEGGTVRFAISDDAVNFHDFARLFRDELKCRNALFLDGGNGVGLYLPEMRRNDFSWHGGYGPMFGLVD
ncbi:MAG: phosphodiester glycosidase family protein [Rhizobiaceae bacterium]